GGVDLRRQVFQQDARRTGFQRALAVHADVNGPSQARAKFLHVADAGEIDAAIVELEGHIALLEIVARVIEAAGERNTRRSSGDVETGDVDRVGKIVDASLHAIERFVVNGGGCEIEVGVAMRIFERSGQMRRPGEAAFRGNVRALCDGQDTLHWKIR